MRKCDRTRFRVITEYRCPCDECAGELLIPADVFQFEGLREAVDEYRNQKHYVHANVHTEGSDDPWQDGYSSIRCVGESYRKRIAHDNNPIAVSVSFHFDYYWVSKSSARRIAKLLGVGGLEKHYDPLTMPKRPRILWADLTEEEQKQMLKDAQVAIVNVGRDDTHVVDDSHEVIVDNIGTVYEGKDEKEAERLYDLYVKQSQEGTKIVEGRVECFGRGGGESVSWIWNMDIHKSHTGPMDLYEQEGADIGYTIRKTSLFEVIGPAGMELAELVYLIEQTKMEPDRTEYDYDTEGE